MSNKSSDKSYAQYFFDTLIEVVRSPFDAIRKFFADLADSDDATRNAERIGERIMAWGTLPFRLLVAFGSFILFSWSSSRSVRAFVFAAPAILGLLGYIGAVLAADMFRGETKMIATNMSYYQHHTNNSPNNPEWAEIFGRRLVDDHPNEPEYKFILAESLIRMGEVEEAEELMRVIAPIDRAGYGKAHLWLANRLTNQANNISELEDTRQDDQVMPVSAVPEELEELAFKHYQFALEVLPEQVEPRFQIGRMFELRAERLPEGSPEKIANLVKADEFYRFGATQPINFLDAASGVIEKRIDHHYKIVSLACTARVRMHLTKLAPQQYPPDAVKNEIRDQINNLLPSVRLKAANDYRLWRSLVLCAMEIEDYERTTEILQSALEATESNDTKQRLLQYAADAQVIQAKRVKNLFQRPNYALRLRVLCRAIVNNPRNAKAYEMLLEYIGESKPIEDPTQIPEDYVPIKLEWLIAEGSGSSYSGVINALAGIHFMDQGNVKQGRKYWEIGAKFDPNTKRYINFMLQAISLRQQKRSFNHVRDMLALAIESFSFPELYATRAAFARSEGRFDDAVKDYEAFLGIRPDEVSVLQFAKLCHRKLGNGDSVIKYDKRLDEVVGQYSEARRTNARKLLKFIEEKFEEGSQRK